MKPEDALKRALPTQPPKPAKKSPKKGYVASSHAGKITIAKQTMKPAITKQAIVIARVVFTPLLSGHPITPRKPTQRNSVAKVRMHS